MKKLLLFFKPKGYEAPSEQQTIDKNQKKLYKFLEFVTLGKQAEAKTMLEKYKWLAKESAENVIDSIYTERKFEQITGFQYAVWALDFHMWSMIKEYLSKEEELKQLEKLNQIATLDEQQGWVLHIEQCIGWPSCSWAPLIKALDEYVKNYNDIHRSRSMNWSQEVGGAQLTLPAHVINEYRHPSRPFHPCPQWGDNEPALPRKLDIRSWRLFSWKDSNGDYFCSYLGKDFAWCRASYQHDVQRAYHDGKFYSCYPDYPELQQASSDLLAVNELLKSRVKQVRLLLDSVGLSATTAVIDPNVLSNRSNFEHHLLGE